jgi:hypothetical protein
MPTDNVPLPASTGKAATREIVYSGELAQAQAVGLVTFEGPDDAKTATDVNDDNPLPIKVLGEAIEAIEAMRMSLQSLNRTIGLMQPDAAARMRVAIDSISASLTLATITTVGTVTTVTTVTTVATLTNQTQIGGIAATEQVPSLVRLAGDSLRRSINVT